MTTCKKSRIFSVDEVTRKAVTIETFDRLKGRRCRWANNGNGTFHLVFPEVDDYVVKTTAELYKKIKLAVHDQRIIAMRKHPNSRLFATNEKLV